MNSSKPLLLALLVALAAIVSAQTHNPFIGRDEFPQFRQLSGLSGGGYGLDMDGWGDLGGPTALSTPLGIALGHDQVRASGGETFFSWDQFSHANSTGKINLMYGHSFGHLNVAYSYFIKSFEGDASTNLQASYNFGERMPSVSFGVQDVVGNGGSSGQGIAGDNASSRSFFGAATMPIQTGHTPVYVTAGWGTRRFGKASASATYQLLNPVRLFAEYDGWGFNEGVLLAYRGNDRNEDGDKQHAFEADLMLGIIRGHYPTAALTIGF